MNFPNTLSREEQETLDRLWRERIEELKSMRAKAAMDDLLHPADRERIVCLLDRHIAESEAIL